MSLLDQGNQNTSGDNPNPENNDGEGGRPDWLPEAYWNEDTKTAEIRKVVDALSDTQTALRNRKEEMRKELEEERKKNRPETAESYTVEFEEGGFKLSADDPIVGTIREWAHNTGLSQEEFSGLVNAYGKTASHIVPDPQKEMEKLGENAKDRVGALSGLAAKAGLSEEENAALRAFTTKADMITTLEKLIKANKPDGPGTFQADMETQLATQEELDRVMSSDAYWARDKATIAKAERLRQKLAASGG